MSLESTGAGLKNLAIGAGVLLVAGVVVYALLKGKKLLDSVGVAASDVGGFLFSAGEAPETLGSTLHDLLNTPPDRNPDGKPYYWDYAQAERTKIALIGQREKTYGVD